MAEWLHDNQEEILWAVGIFVGVMFVVGWTATLWAMQEDLESKLERYRRWR